MFKVVVGSNNIRIFNIKSSEINSDLKIIIARFFFWVLPFILHFFIFHSRQFLLNERSGNFTALAFMSKMLLPPYSPVDRTVKPKTEHALWGKIASIYGFQYQLFRVLVGFPNNERVVNKTQAKTNIRFQMHRFAFENSIKDWQKETIALFEISNIHTMIFKKETLSFKQ